MKKEAKRVLSVALVLIIALSCLSLTACDSRETNGQLLVGMECGYAPFNYTREDEEYGSVKISNDEGYANGYDVMVAKRIAESMNKELVIVKYTWDGLINGVQSGALDFIIAGMSATDDRRESIDFSDAYYESQLVVVVRKNGKYAGAKSLADLSGAKIAAQQGTFHDVALEAQGGEYGIIRQTPMEDFPAMAAALSVGTIDGYVAEDPGARADCAANGDFTFIALENNTTGFKVEKNDVAISVGLKKGSPYLAEVNGAIAGISAEERAEMLQSAISLYEEGALDSSDANKNFFAAAGSILARYWKRLLKGVGYTLLVSLISTIIGLIIGILIGIYRTMQLPKNKFLRVLKKIGDWIFAAYIEVFRGTPMMVQAMVIFWGFALLNGGTTLNPIFAGFIIVSINTGAYMAEIVRGGIISIDKGQFEGAAAIGMTHFQTMTNVVMPQVLRNILPSVANEFVVNVKDTSVLNIIGFTELFFQAKSIAAINFNLFATYLLVAAIYFILTFTITRVLRLIEKKMDGKENYVVLGSQNMDADSYAREKNN
ncbi:MAG: ABC transporter substrate-binding protein/permease [Firmicutes bacterium]|nr:ABC transporter substrate-binding protein/permease [Bacillota bacterium]